MCLAAADAVIDVIENEKLVERSARMGEVMRGHMTRLKAKHPSVREHRNIGLFGIIELAKNTRGERLVPYAGSHPVMAKLGKFFRDNGLFTLLQWGGVMCNPPLTISEAELAEGFEIIDRGLAITDEVFEAA
jgi:taurine--2-oxoglutarate transaminase